MSEEQTPYQLTEESGRRRYDFQVGKNVENITIEQDANILIEWQMPGEASITIRRGQEFGGYGVIITISPVED